MPSKTSKNAPREREIQKAVIDYLTLTKRFFYRNNSGSFRTERGGYYTFGAVGSPDIVCVSDGRYIGIEVKRPGAKQSEGQKRFQENLEKAGGKYLIVTDVEDLIKAFENEL